jgi:hypothetical protein
MNIGFTYGRDVRFDSLSKRTKTTNQTNLKFEWTTYPNFSPQLMFKLVDDTLAHPMFGKRTSSSILAKFSLRWTPNRIVRNDFSISWKALNREEESTHTYSFTDTLNWKISDLLSSITSLEAGYLTGTVNEDKLKKLEIELSHTLSSKLANNWNGSFTGGYLLGFSNQNSTDNYQSFTAELKITTLF